MSDRENRPKTEEEVQAAIKTVLQERPQGYATDVLLTRLNKMGVSDPVHISALLGLISTHEVKLTPEFFIKLP